MKEILLQTSVISKTRLHKILLPAIIWLLIFSAFTSANAQCTYFTKIATAESGNTTLGIKSDGTLWGWGNNNFGQLGDGTTTNRSVPTRIGSASNWIAVAHNGSVSYGITADGMLWAWGYNNFYGQVGDGTTTNILTGPKRIGTGTNWTTIAAGGEHVLALTADGRLWGWGKNSSGEVGNGTTANVTQGPIQIGDATDWATIAAGGAQSMAIKNNGTLWAWGKNSYGQLGDGTTTNITAGPKQIGTKTDWTAISHGFIHTIGLTADGALWMWGQNNDGQFGDGSTTSSLIPKRIGTGTNWVSIGAGYYQSFGITRDGKAWGWGNNNYGQLGLGNTVKRPNITQIGTATNWASIVPGNYYTMATTTDGKVFAFGQNNYGQLGDNSLTLQTSPVTTAPEISYTGLATNQATVTAYQQSLVNYAADCESLIATVTQLPYNTSRIRGNTTARVWIDPEQNAGWLARHYEIMPSENAGIVSGRVTLYATQAEFDAYNSVNTVSLPVNAGDDAGIARLSITKYAGSTSNLETGLPDTYTGAVTQIDPDDVSIVYNSAAARWEITFDVAGFGAFFIRSSYSVFSSAGPNGSISPVGSTRLPQGDGQTYTINPNTCYKIADVLIDGVSAGAVSTYTFENVTENHTISASFIVDLPTITTQPAAQSVLAGENVTFTVEASGVGPFTYQWKKGGTNVGTNSPTLILSGVVIADAASYSCVVTGACGNVTSSAAKLLVTSPCAYFTKIATGENGKTPLGLKSDGTLWGWGPNSSGQIGDGSTVDRSTPTQIGTATNWINIANNGNTSYAISADGRLWAWGYNAFYGQVGDGRTVNVTNGPKLIGTASNWTALASGSEHIIALTSDGKLWGWGKNTNGQVGDGTVTNITNGPRQIGNATDWATIAAGNAQSMAIKKDGTLWAWGKNNLGQLGDGTITDITTGPKQIGTGSNWVAISMGVRHSMGLTENGELYIWGDNSYGQLGTGTSVLSVTQPTRIGTATNWMAIGAGYFQSYAITSDGKAWACGNNFYGQLGDGTLSHKRSFTQIGTATNWAAIAPGNYFTIGTTSDGQTWAFGQNDRNQLGDGTMVNKSTPVSIAAAPSYTSLASGQTSITHYQHNLIKYANGCTDLIATVNQLPYNSTRISGTTTAKVWVDGEQNAGWVARHYEILPSVNAADATGRVTLYAAQAEFDAYNLSNATQLPTATDDAGGIANLHIVKYEGSTSNAGTGFPDTYAGAKTIIDPADANIIYNSTAARWEITFDVKGFGAFFIQTQAISITATAGANGTISPSGTTQIASGAGQTYTITPNSCHEIADVLVDGVSVGAVTNYTFSNITESHTIAASFIPADLPTVEGPESQTVCAEENVTFTVAATGTNLTYQWKKGETNVGTNATVLTLTAVTAEDAGIYTCVVTSDCGTLTSETAVLIVNEKPAISEQPESQTFCAEENVTFTVAATGTNLTYQWKKGETNVGTNATVLTLTAVTAEDAGIYTCVVTSDCGTLTSETAVLIVNKTPVISEQPESQTVCVEENVTFTVAATGNNLTYQWKKGETNVGTNATVLTLNDVTAEDAGIYTCVVTSDCGTLTSETAVLIVNETPAISEQPESQTVCAEENVTFTVAATGNNLTYQWKKGETNVGTNAPVLTLTDVTAEDAADYTCVVTSDCGTLTSETAVLIVTIPVNSALATAYTTATRNVNTESASFADNCTDLIATIQPGGTEPVSGNVEEHVWIDETPNSGWVSRHFQITPAQNAATATGRITLYATDAEFYDYNNNIPAPDLLLPQSSETGTVLSGHIANLRILKYAGSSGDIATGLPDTYAGVKTIITPSATDVVYNTVAARWEISFDVTGFSGFFIATESSPALPVTWISVSSNLNSQHQAVINWKVVESSVDGYEVEISSDAISFSSISKIASKGDGTHIYSFTHEQEALNAAYFRIKQTDVDGGVSYSRIVKIVPNTIQAINVYPNPANYYVTVKVDGSLLNTEAILLNSRGQAVRQITSIEGTFVINTIDLPDGIYLLKMQNGSTSKLVVQH